jgi:hypothetical protein
MTLPVKVTELDFELIKENLKTWMREQSNFTDFDYEASGLSFVLDVLSYNTHYNAILANFMANEMFLDTALKRGSVISHAKSLGYHPKSVHSARQNISIVINDLSLATGFTAPDNFIIRRGTAFITQIESGLYQFVTEKDYAAPKALDGSYTFSNIEIVEGIFNSFAYKVESSEYNVKYTLPVHSCDISTLKIFIHDNASALSSEQYNHTSTIFDLDSASNVFFTQETNDGLTEFYFGNGVIGKRPAVGNFIRAEYISSNGAAGNGAKSFAAASNISSNNIDEIRARTYTINIVDNTKPSNGGSNAESIDEIKYYASNHFTVQNRAVTKRDYEAIVRENFFNIDSIKVWGGEENVPPHYNAVFICVKPANTNYLTDYEKEQIREILRSKIIMNMKTIFSDPEYLNLIVDSTIYYSPSKVQSGVDIDTIIKTKIANFNTLNLGKFGSPMKHSNFVTIIDLIIDLI